MIASASKREGSEHASAAPDRSTAAASSARAPVGPFADLLTLQRALGNREVGRLIRSARGGGRPLDPGIRADMDASFGHDFRHVRIHADARAGEEARAVNARAFTVGRDVVFGAGQYAPGTSEGRRLLAHELAHVVQQGLGGADPTTPIPGSRTEAEAERAASTVASSGAARVSEGAAPGVARQVTATQDPARMPDQALETEIGFLTQWISEHPASTEEGDQVAKRLAVLEAEVHRRNEQQRASADASRPQAAGKTEGGTTPSIAQAGVGAAAVAGGLGTTATLGGGAAGGVTTAGGAATGAGVGAGGSALMAVAAPVTAFLAVTLYPRGTIMSGEEERQLLLQIAMRVGDQVRSLTGQLAIHLARFLGTSVSGRPPDHQRDPKRDRPHWWTEIKNFIKEIQSKGLSKKQLLRELLKKFSPEQLAEIREALRRVAEAMGEDPPDFPPIDL